MTADVVHPAELEAVLQARVAAVRSTPPKARRASRTGRRFSIAKSAFATSLLATALLATSVFADGGTLDVEVADRAGYAADTTDDGAIVEYIGDKNETFGSSGSGVFDAFVRVQAAPNEQGYNTDGDRESPPFDTKAGAFTHSILVSEIPVVTIDGQGDQLYWELFADINDSDSTPLISLNDLEVYFTEDPEITDYPFTGTATNVYDFSGTIQINDVNQGSGRGDLRYNIPLTGITIPDDCDYGNSACETYFVLYSEWGDTGGGYTSDGGFEEWKVKQYPTLKIVKNTVGGDGTFDFTVTGPSAPLAPAPSITTSGNTGETLTYVVDPGTYTIDEDGPPAGWTLNGATCSFDGDPAEAYTPGDDLVLEDQTHVVCTFTNTQDGRIEIEKQTVPDGSTTDFTFGGDVGGTLSDGESAGADVAPGSYTSTETVPDGWTLTTIVCDDTDSTGDTATGIASFEVAAGETVRCVFTNTQDGRIEIEKQTVPDGSTTDFTFGGDVGGTLSDGESAGADVAPGSYTSTETVPDGWTLTTIVCDDTDSTGDTATGIASFEVAAGETVRCVFTNTQDGRIEIEKQTVPDGSTTDFTFGGDVGGTLSDGESAGADVAPGSYTSTETVPDGWTLTTIVCDDTDSTGDTATGIASFEVAAGETVRCVFTNTQDGRIEIEKQTVPDGSTTDFTFGGDVGGTLSDGESAGADVAPGSYTSTETVPDGWTLTTIVCDDTDSTGDTATGIASFEVAAGETVRCVFTNTQDVVNEGCTPGFWQGGVGGTLWDELNDPQWTAASGDGTNPFVTTDTFVSFFPSSGNTTVDDMQMIEIVGAGGTNDWALKAARDLIAAYLNASFGLDYPYDTATILADWNTAVVDGTAGFQTFHAKYSAANELGCPIGAPASSDVGIGAVLIAGSLAAVRLVKSRRRRIG